MQTNKDYHPIRILKIHRRRLHRQKHSFIHSFIFAINHIQIQQQYAEIYNTLKIIYTILTKLFTKLNVLSGNDKEAYIEAGGL